MYADVCPTNNQMELEEGRRCNNASMIVRKTGNLRTIRAQICIPYHVLSESETDSTDCSPTSVAA
jgi:hypothetical protein